MAHIQSEKLVLVQFCFHESQFCCPAELPFASNTQYSASHCGIHKLVVIAGGGGEGGGGRRRRRRGRIDVRSAAASVASSSTRRTSLRPASARWPPSSCLAPKCPPPSCWRWRRWRGGGGGGRARGPADMAGANNMAARRCFRALVLALVAASAAARTNEHCESFLIHLISD